jgi:hypothetical protein
MKKRYLFIIFLIIWLGGNAQGKRELFRGGMFLHAGYITNKLDYPAVNGITTGIGGKISFRLGKHFRAGTEGYATSYGYENNEGQYKLGWGGLLAEYQFSDQRLAPVIGITLGGGVIHDLYVANGNFTDNLPDEAIYKVYSAFIANPHFSLEYRLTHNINLVGKIDCLLFPGVSYPDYVANGPRLYVGILFMR